MTYRSAFGITVVGLGLAIAAAGTASAATIDINGGSSWGGWTSKGASNTLGVYGSGSTMAVYDVYTAVFLFNNHSADFTGGAVGGGPTGGGT